MEWAEQYFIQQILSSICALTFAVVKPYKLEFYNKLDVAIFLLLSVMNAFSSYNSQLYHKDNHISKPVFWINYLLAFLPLLYIISYVVYLILLWKGYLKRKTKLPENVRLITDPPDNDTSDNEDIPDRLVNPQNYNSQNLYIPNNKNAAVLPDPPSQEQSRQDWSEKSYFHARRDPQLVPYGSLTTTECHMEPN